MLIRPKKKPKWPFVLVSVVVVSALVAGIFLAQYLMF